MNPQQGPRDLESGVGGGGGGGGLTTWPVTVT